MGLETTDGFLSTLSDFQTQQAKEKKGWITVTIKRDRVKSMKKQLSRKKKQAQLEKLSNEALLNPTQLYSLKYRAKYNDQSTCAEILPGKSIKESDQLVNVFRLHFFSNQAANKTKVIKKEPTKPNPKSKNAKRRQERHKRNAERRKKHHEIQVQAKKKRQQALNIKHTSKEKQQQQQEQSEQTIVQE
ncbi:hypothetical protein ABPG74_020274 [Tetrahymena malaccensis]